MFEALKGFFLATYMAVAGWFGTVAPVGDVEIVSTVDTNGVAQVEEKVTT